MFSRLDQNEWQKINIDLAHFWLISHELMWEYMLRLRPDEVDVGTFIRTLSHYVVSRSSMWNAQTFYLKLTFLSLHMQERFDSWWNFGGRKKCSLSFFHQSLIMNRSVLAYVMREKSISNSAVKNELIKTKKQKFVPFSLGREDLTSQAWFSTRMENQQTSDRRDDIPQTQKIYMNFLRCSENSILARDTHGLEPIVENTLVIAQFSPIAKVYAANEQNIQSAMPTNRTFDRQCDKVSPRTLAESFRQSSGLGQYNSRDHRTNESLCPDNGGLVVPNQIPNAPDNSHL